MNRQRPLILLLLVVYIFSPMLVGWVIAEDGTWYRPFLIWALMVVAAYVMQERGKPNDL